VVGTTKCAACGSPITFKRTPAGRWCPCELDGSDHFDKCSRLKFDRLRAEGAHFDRRATDGVNVRETGYSHRELGTKRDGLTGRVRRGAAFNPCPETCSTPPWEPCLACPHGDKYQLPRRGAGVSGGVR